MDDTKSKPSPVDIFEEAVIAELYGHHLFEMEERVYYIFQRHETGSCAYLVPVSNDEYQVCVFEEDRKFVHPRISPGLFKFFHSVSFDGLDRSYVAKLKRGGQVFARKINQAFINVLVASRSFTIQTRGGEMNDLLARGSDWLTEQGFRADRFLFPARFKDRMLRQGIVTPDDEISSPNYAGKTFSGLDVFWSRELPDDIALLFDSTAGVTIGDKEPRFDSQPKGFSIFVYGLLEINPIVKNTQAVVALDGIEQVISRGTKSSITISTENVDRFLNDIRTEIETSPIEEAFGEVALYDLEQARRAYGSRAFKACVIMLGAVLEGLMLGTLRRPEALNLMRNDTSFPSSIGRSLGGLGRPEYSDDAAFADAIAERLSFEDYRTLICRYMPDIERLRVEGIQNFRNAVHPWRAVQTPTVYGDYEEARATSHLTALLLLARHILPWTP